MKVGLVLEYISALAVGTSTSYKAKIDSINLNHHRANRE